MVGSTINGLDMEIEETIAVGRSLGIELQDFRNEVKAIIEGEVTVTMPKSKRREGRKETRNWLELPNDVRREETRNWLELPNDVMANILYRVGVIDILENAQKVCTAWRNICKDPAMWKVLHMENFWDPCSRPPLQDMCKHAVDRSQGQLLHLDIVDFCNHELLVYVAERSSQLRRLEITYCFGEICGGWGECLMKFVLLEELSLLATEISEEDIEAAGRYCPLLKTLKVNLMQFQYSHPFSLEYIFDGMALAIGKHLPKLRHLELIGDSLSNIGLQAILDGCRDLELLDLRRCVHVDLKGDLGKRCLKQIKHVKLPNDPVDPESSCVTIEPKVYREYDEEDDDDDSDDDDEDDDEDDDDSDGDDDDDDDFADFSD